MEHLELGKSLDKGLLAPLPMLGLLLLARMLLMGRGPSEGKQGLERRVALGQWLRLVPVVQMQSLLLVLLPLLVLVDRLEDLELFLPVSPPPMLLVGVMLQWVPGKQGKPRSQLLKQQAVPIENLHLPPYLAHELDLALDPEGQKHDHEDTSGGASSGSDAAGSETGSGGVSWVLVMKDRNRVSLSKGGISIYNPVN